jgi:putative transposase
MPRKPREDVAGAVQHVFARGNNKRRIFLDERDRRRYLAILERVVRAKRWLCLAYCLLDNHVHLLLETPHPNLGTGMQLLHGLYGTTHNRRHGLSGHVFQGRFGSRRVTTDAQLWMVVRYIAANPVEAGLCQTAEGWPWSSHARLASGTPPTWLDVDRLLEHFEAMGGEPERRYAEWLAAEAA